MALTINGNRNTKKKPPHWKFNNSLLENTDYKRTINDVIKSYIHALKTTESARELWDDFKLRIKEVSIIKAKQINSDRRKRQHFLEQVIHIARQLGTQHQPQTLDAQKELEEILQHKYKGAQIRTRYNTSLDETPTAVFLAFEQNIQNNRTITQITDTQGNIQTDTHKITNAFKDFYSTLYSASTPNTADNSSQQTDYMKYTVKLTDTQKQTLDTPIDIDLVQTSLNSQSKNSSPGPDGLSPEFYQAFFPTLSPLFMAMLKEVFDKEGLTESQNLVRASSVGFMCVQ